MWNECHVSPNVNHVTLEWKLSLVRCCGRRLLSLRPESFPWQPETWHHSVRIVFFNWSFNSDCSRYKMWQKICLCYCGNLQKKMVDLSNKETFESVLRCFLVNIPHWSQCEYWILIWFWRLLLYQRKTDRQTQSDMLTSPEGLCGSTIWKKNWSRHLLYCPMAAHPCTRTQKDTQKRTHTPLPPVVPLSPGISESSCASSAVVVNQNFLLIDLPA